MDASSIQSSSKCSGSDFSIERILGDRKDSRETVEAPEWLCCTRYRPPRIPRAASGGRSRRAGRHARVPFTAAQAAALEAAYSRAPYLAPPALKALAAALNLRDDRIKIWFQNRRARERREKSVNIIPPQGVALPATSSTSSSATRISPSHQYSFVSSPQSFINTQQLGPINFPVRENSHDVLLHRFQVPLNRIESFHDQGIMTRVCVQGEDEERSTTPLDIESVDD